jgi:hypothetical protein
MPIIRLVKFGDFASSIITLVSGIRKKSPKTFDQSPPAASRLHARDAWEFGPLEDADADGECFCETTAQNRRY